MWEGTREVFPLIWYSQVAAVDEIHAKAIAASASITQSPERSMISHSFTAV